MTATDHEATPRITHPRLVEVATYLGATRADFVGAAHEVPVAHWSDAPGDGAWSAAQIVDHLRIVEHGIVRLVQKLVPAARAEGLAAETDTGSVIDAAFIARTTDRSRRIEAPPRVLPAGAPDRDAGLAAMRAERAELLAAMADADGLALGSLEWAHPALGAMDLYRWLVFVGALEARHAAQLRDLVRALATT